MAQPIRSAFTEETARAKVKAPEVEALTLNKTLTEPSVRILRT